MRTASKCFFVAEPVAEAYRDWKRYLDGAHRDRTGRAGLTVTQDRFAEEVRWRSRWGVLAVQGRADFIPVSGGCILHLAYSGPGLLPRLLLQLRRRPGSLEGTPGTGPARPSKGERWQAAGRAVAKPFDVFR